MFAQLRRYETTSDGRIGQTTQIDEGTNQIQRIVVARQLRK